MKIFFSALLICFSFILRAQKPAFSVYLIGDTGELMDSSANFKNLMMQMEQNPFSTVIILGDNIYPNGLIEEKRDHNSHKIIRDQLKMFTNFKGNVYFIPGNHD
ncbi:MAG: metallophosphoesterase, partial [Chitinophagales bacterium]|nr:metallophosphoesterase [Chitinophagales bacterium]